MKNRGWEKKGGGSQILGCMYARGGGVIQMHTLCNRGGGGVSKSGKNAYVINGRPLWYDSQSVLT